MPEMSDDVKQRIKDYDIKVNEEDDIKVRNKKSKYLNI